VQLSPNRWDLLSDHWTHTEKARCWLKPYTWIWLLPQSLFWSVLCCGHCYDDENLGSAKSCGKSSTAITVQPSPQGTAQVLIIEAVPTTERGSKELLRYQSGPCVRYKPPPSCFVTMGAMIGCKGHLVGLNCTWRRVSEWLWKSLQKQLSTGRLWSRMRVLLLYHRCHSCATPVTFETWHWMFTWQRFQQNQHVLRYERRTNGLGGPKHGSTAW
jgi:hypothetical protein